MNMLFEKKFFLIFFLINKICLFQVVETQKKQCELWGDLILAYCQANKIYDVQVSEAVTKLPIFHNKTINRKLDASQLTVFLDYLAEKGNI